MLAIALPGRTHAHSMSSVRISAPPLTDPDSDGMLVLRAAAGDARAFDDIVRRHTALLRTTASRILRSSSDVDDAVQDTFIAAWRHLHTLTDGATIGGWLLTTLRRQCYSRLRSAAHRHRADFDGDVAEASERGPASMCARSALATEARAVLDRMPELQRRCWELRQLHEASYRDIAVELGVSTSVVRGQLARARSLMETTLSHWR